MSIKIGRFCLCRLVLRFFFARNAADGPARPGKSTLPLGLALRCCSIDYLISSAKGPPKYSSLWREVLLLDYMKLDLLHPSHLLLPYNHRTHIPNRNKGNHQKNFPQTLSRKSDILLYRFYRSSNLSCLLTFSNFLFGYFANVCIIPSLDTAISCVFSS